jgi:hypothetical protein
MDEQKVNKMDVMYEIGEELTIANSWVILNGILTGSAKSIAFTIPTPKIMQDVAPVFKSLKLNGRSANSSFTFAEAAVTGGYDILKDDSIRVEVEVATGTLIGVKLTKKTGAFSGANNAPVALQVGEIVINFNSAV